MIYQADAKRPDEAPVFSLDVKKELATGETVSSVTTAIEVASSGADPDVANMLQGSPAVSGSIVSQKVRNGIDGNAYNLKFTVTTTQQTLVLVMNIPVKNDGAFD